MPDVDDVRSPAAPAGRHGQDVPVLQDRIFDGLAEKFAASLYGSARGRIRLAVLEQVLSRELPANGCAALDVGGGLGQMSAWLARRGHAVTLAEPSRDMLAAAEPHLTGLDVTRWPLTLQTLAERAERRWPLIVCHAVLEWLADPRQALTQLKALLDDEGRLSLMVFNRDALRFSNVIKGNLDKALEDRLSGTGKRQRLTPISPLTHDDIVTWCHETGLRIERVAGVRIFHDYLRDRGPSDAALEKVIALETRYCQTEPYWRLGRYLHYTLRHAEGDRATSLHGDESRR